MSPDAMAIPLAMRAGRRARRAAASTRLERSHCCGNESGERRSISSHTNEPVDSQTVFKRIIVRIFSVLPKHVRTLAVRHLTPNFTAGVVTLIVRDNGDVLFLRMTYRKGWGLPGGLMGRNERPEYTAQREIAEELGIDVPEPEIYRVHTAPRLQTVTFFTRTRITDEQAMSLRIDPVEIASAEWFAPDAMPELDKEIAPLDDQDRAAAKELVL
jgi:8-oxo-dGTP pyrophosphatase MutT (NUDIX family)